MSQLSGSIRGYSTLDMGSFVVKDCKLHASALLSGSTSVFSPQVVQGIRSDSGATAYKSARFSSQATETTETSITRVGGAVDPGGQAQSRKIVSTTNALLIDWLRPFVAEPFAIWNATTGANVTVTVCGTINAGAVPNNDDIWMDVEYLAGLPVAASIGKWDALNASFVTISGSDLVATNTGTTSTNQGAHVAFDGGQTTGKFYFEVTVTTYTGGAGVGAGIGNIASVYSSLSAMSAGSLGNICFVVGHTGSGTVSDNGGNSGVTLGALTSGDVICVACDLTNRRLWFRKNAAGNWNNTAGNDPTDGSGLHGGLTIQAGTIVPFVTFGSGPAGAAGVAGNVFTANFSASGFVGAVPSGYTAGWPTPAVPTKPLGKIVTTTKATVLSSNAAVASDSSSWNGGGSGAGWSPFKLTLTLSSPQPQMAGFIEARVRVAKPSATYYIDPMPVLS